MTAPPLYRCQAPVSRGAVLTLLALVNTPLVVPAWLAMRHFLAAADAGRPLAEVAWVLWFLGAVTVLQMLGLATALVARWEVAVHPDRVLLRLHPLPPWRLPLETLENAEVLPGPSRPARRLFRPVSWAGAPIPEEAGTAGGILLRTVDGRAWLLRLPDPAAFLEALARAYRKLPVATSSTTPSTTRKTTTRLRAGTP